MILDFSLIESKSMPEPNSGCWLWLGCLTIGTGYPRIDVYKNGKRKVLAGHRLSWELANDKKIPSGMLVCHRCGNRACVNPEHLYCGTYKDNNHDTMRHGRYVCPSNVGSKHPRALLNEEVVKKIRSDHIRGLKLRDLANKYFVSQPTIEAVVYRRLWRHVN